MRKVEAFSSAGKFQARPKNLYTTLQFDSKVWTKPIQSNWTQHIGFLAETEKISLKIIKFCFQNLFFSFQNFLKNFLAARFFIFIFQKI